MPKIVAGAKQSPIDIRPTDAVFDGNLQGGKLKFSYHANDCCEMVNTGTTWAAWSDRSKTAQSTFTGPHLTDTYKFIQLHGHWASNCWNGSEHQILSRGFASELHFVHWNTKYGSFGDAAVQPDGLAVVAVFLEETPLETANPALDQLLRCLSEIKGISSSTPMLSGFDLAQLVPEKLDFWTYKGSLTTPPYNESVVWTVIRDPIPISFNQLKIFRSLYSNNVRPIQNKGNAMNDLQLRSSFELGGRVGAAPRS